MWLSGECRLIDVYVTTYIASSDLINRERVANLGALELLLTLHYTTL